MLPLRPGPLPDVDVRNIIFITRPSLKLMNCIADNVHSIDKRLKSATTKELFLYFLPRTSSLCETQLKNKGVYGSFTHVGEFKCDFFPVDNDLLSMELKDSFRLVQRKTFPYFTLTINLLTIRFLIDIVSCTSKMIQRAFFYRQRRCFHSKNCTAAFQRFTAKEIMRENCGIY